MIGVALSWLLARNVSLPLAIIGGLAMWALGAWAGWQSHQKWDDAVGYPEVRRQALHGYVLETEKLAAEARAKQTQMQLDAAIDAQRRLEASLQEITERYKLEDQEDERDRAAYEEKLRQAEAAKRCSTALTQRDVDWLRRKAGQGKAGSSR